MYEFYLQGRIHIQLVEITGDERKTQKKESNRTKEKPVQLPSHPPSIKWKQTVFWSPRGLKTSRTFPNGKGK